MFRWKNGAHDTLFLLLGSSLCFSLCTACVKAVGPGISTYEKVFIRSWTNVLFLVLPPISSTGTGDGRRELRTLFKRTDAQTRLLLCMRGLVGFVALSSFFEATQWLSLAHLTVLTRIHPCISAVLGAVVLGEGISLKIIARLCSAFIGVIMVIQPPGYDKNGIHGNAMSSFGVCLALSAALFTAIAFLTIRQLGLNSCPRELTVFAFHGAGIPLSFLLGMSSFSWPSAVQLGWMICSAICMHFAQECMTRLLEKNKLVRSSPSSFMIICWNTAIGIILGDRWPNVSAVVGCLLILGPTLATELSVAGGTKATNGTSRPKKLN